MSCPVCAAAVKNGICPVCGYDRSRDYEKYPTFGTVGKTPSVAGMRARRRPQPHGGSAHGRHRGVRRQI